MSLSKRHEQAAQLLAADEISDREIAQRIGITERTLNNWKRKSNFALRVETIQKAFRERALSKKLARREVRVNVLNDIHDKMLQVVNARAEDPSLAKVPGGNTGLVTLQLKAIGRGPDQKLIPMHEVDTGLIREIRATQEQVARELGQVHAQRLRIIRGAEDLTDEELAALAEGKTDEQRESGGDGSGPGPDDTGNTPSES